MSCIYFIRAAESGRIKIGFTAGDPEKRRRALQTGSAEKLVLEAACNGTQDDERALHRLLSAYRLSGEWFEPAPAVLAELASAKESPASIQAQRKHTGRMQLMARDIGSVPARVYQGHDSELARARAATQADLDAARCGAHQHKSCREAVRCCQFGLGRTRLNSPHARAQRARAHKIDRRRIRAARADNRAQRRAARAADPALALQWRRRLALGILAGALAIVVASISVWAASRPPRPVSLLKITWALAANSEPPLTNWSDEGESANGIIASCRTLRAGARVSVQVQRATTPEDLAWSSYDAGGSTSVTARSLFIGSAPSAVYVRCVDTSGAVDSVARCSPAFGRTVACEVNYATIDDCPSRLYFYPGTDNHRCRSEMDAYTQSDLVTAHLREDRSRYQLSGETVRFLELRRPV